MAKHLLTVAKRLPVPNKETFVYLTIKTDAEGIKNLFFPDKPKASHKGKRCWPSAPLAAVPRHIVEYDMTRAEVILSCEGYALNEDGVARAFVESYGGGLKYDHDSGTWFFWNGRIWKENRTGLAFDKIRVTTRNFVSNMHNQIEAEKAKRSLGKASSVTGIEKFVKNDLKIAINSAAWDADKFLLGTPDGTIDLRTGEVMKPNPKHLITKTTAVAPGRNVNCPLWLSFLNDATGHDQELIDSLQSFFGYSLTGDTREHALIFGYGPGGNGKSVLLNTVSHIMGDYYKTAAMDTFTATKNDKHPTDMAMLRGARLVGVSEVQDGASWDEVKLKRLTGGDEVPARFMRQDFFHYVPQFKLFIIGNHRPRIVNPDEAMKRRLNLVPFLFKPEKADRELETKLRAEAPAILAWLIDGCTRWQKEGFKQAKVMLAATEAYFGEQDTMRAWLDDCCDLSPSYSATAKDLFASWVSWAKEHGENAGTQTRFGENMNRLNFNKTARVEGIARQARGYRGLRLKAPFKRTEADD
jgi:putative DNA primase/helicase